MPTKATPLRGAKLGGFVKPFRLSTASRLQLTSLGWTEDMLTELDRRVESARFDSEILKPTPAQSKAALESLGRAAARLETELNALDGWTAQHIDVVIMERLQDLGTTGRDFRNRLRDGAGALSVLTKRIIGDAPKTKRGAPEKVINNAVVEIVRDIMRRHGQEPMTEGGSAGVAATAVLREIGALDAVTARHPLRRTKGRK